MTENIQNLLETIIQYMNHLKSLTNQDMDTKNKEEIIKLLCKSPENVESAFEIAENLAGIKNHLVNKVFFPKLKLICEELGLEKVLKEGDVNVKSYGFRINNKKWNNFHIYFEFQVGGLGELLFGICENDKSVNVNKIEAIEKIKLFPRNETKGLPWAYIRKFPSYTHWNKDAMMAITNGEMASLFEKELKTILELTEGLDM